MTRISIPAALLLLCASVSIAQDKDGGKRDSADAPRQHEDAAATYRELLDQYERAAERYREQRRSDILWSLFFIAVFAFITVGALRMTRARSANSPQSLQTLIEQNKAILDLLRSIDQRLQQRND